MFYVKICIDLTVGPSLCTCSFTNISFLPPLAIRLRREDAAATTITKNKLPKKNRTNTLLVQINLNFTSRSTSILRPDRPQFYIRFDFNFTSRSTSISRPDRPQFHIQIDLTFTFRSTSIPRPDRPQSHHSVVKRVYRQFI